MFSGRMLIGMMIPQSQFLSRTKFPKGSDVISADFVHIIVLTYMIRTRLRIPVCRRFSPACTNAGRSSTWQRRCLRQALPSLSSCARMRERLSCNFLWTLSWTYRAFFQITPHIFEPCLASHWLAGGGGRDWKRGLNNNLTLTHTHAYRSDVARVREGAAQCKIGCKVGTGTGGGVLGTSDG